MPRDLLLALSDTPPGKHLALRAALMCKYGRQSLRKQELAESRVGKPGLKPAAKPIRDTGPLRLAQRSISELQLNLIRTQYRGLRNLGHRKERGKSQAFPGNERAVRASEQQPIPAHLGVVTEN